MGKKVDSPGSPPAAPEIPEPDDPGYIITLMSLLNRVNSSGPFGSQTYGQYVTDPETGETIFDRWNTRDDEFLTALGAALADPQNPDIETLVSLWPSDVVMTEDPRLQALREQQQDTAYGMSNIFQGYMSPFGFSAAGLPPSGGGLPPGSGPPPPLPPPAMGGGLIPPNMPGDPRLNPMVNRRPR